MPDLVVRGGIVVTPHGRTAADVAIEDGCITAIGPALPGAPEEIDARGLFVLAGLIDVHVHFNEPGRTEWEGAETGSRALAAGGGTVFFDMPLNSTPCVVNARELDRKRTALEAASIADFALWGGLVPGSVPYMAEMAAHGAIGFKAFMCDSGLPEFPMADDETLESGMREAVRLGLPVAVHAEDEAMVRQHIAATPVRDARSFLASRPIEVELAAIRRALHIAEATGAALHIVHVSSGQGVALAAEARARGVDVSVETCPHYLTFTDEDLERLGALAKCAPPLRSADEQASLWRQLVDGRIDMIASDHSPAAPANKQAAFADCWGGIAGVQSTLPVLLDRSFAHDALTLEGISALVSAAPARRFRLNRKGALAVGGDADLVLIDPARSFTLEPAHLHQRHPMSPYLGRHFRGHILRTIRRGETVFLSGQVTARTKGHVVVPARTHT